MDILTTILACSVYLGGDDVVRAIAESTSEGNPFFVADAALDVTQIDPPPAPKTREDALLRVSSVRAHGGRPLLGLLRLPPAWLSAFGRQEEEAFDPCVNVALGSAMLAQFESECAKAGPLHNADGPALKRPVDSASTSRRPCVLRKYENATGERDFATVTTLELRAQRAVPAAIPEAPIFPPDGEAERLNPILAPLVFRSVAWATAP